MKQTRLREILDEGAVAQTSDKSKAAEGSVDSRSELCRAPGRGHREASLSLSPGLCSQMGGDALDGRSPASPAFSHTEQRLQKVLQGPRSQKSFTTSE